MELKIEADKISKTIQAEKLESKDDALKLGKDVMIALGIDISVKFVSSLHKASKYFLETSGFMKMSVENGNVEFLKFPDGETYHQLKDDLRGKNVCLVGGTETDSSTLELYDMACHIAKQKPKQLIICIPYYGYSTMERAVKHGEVVKAKSRARLLSSIPGNNTFMFLDLHSEGIPHYLEGNATPIHLYAKNIIFSACKDLSNYKNDFVLGSTDAGRAKWVESLSKDMCVNCAIIIKRRSPVS